MCKGQLPHSAYRCASCAQQYSTPQHSRIQSYVRVEAETFGMHFAFAVLTNLEHFALAPGGGVTQTGARRSPGSSLPSHAVPAHSATKPYRWLRRSKQRIPQISKKLICKDQPGRSDGVQDSSEHTRFVWVRVCLFNNGKSVCPTAMMWN